MLQDSLAQDEIVDVHQAAKLRDYENVYFVDVREQWEYDQVHIPNIALLPMQGERNWLEEIPADRIVILTCRSGNRSGQITNLLRQLGYTNVYNMQGGILAWQEASYPVESKA